MRIIHPDARIKPNIRLGVQTNPGNTEKQAHWLAVRWKPAKAKSYTMLSFQHTDYDGHPSDVDTGYADIVVEYFTRKDEGDTQIK